MRLASQSLKVLIEIDVGLAFAIGSRQAAAGADRGDGAADVASGFFHRAADLGEVLQVGAAADVHVEAGDRQAVAIGPAEAVVELVVPDAVLGLLAAGVGLLAVAVAEAGIDAERDVAARGPLAELVDHVGRAAVDRDVRA